MKIKKLDEAIQLTEGGQIPADKVEYAVDSAERLAERIKNDLTNGREVDIPHLKATWKKIIKSSGGWVYGDDLSKLFIQELNKKLAEKGVTNRVNRTKRREATYKNIGNLTPEEFRIAAEWLQEHVTKIKFGIPYADDEGAIYNRLSDKYTELSPEQLDHRVEKLYSTFKNYDQEFHDLFPEAKEGKDYFYRDAANKEDTDIHVDLWGMMGTTTFDTEIRNAPEPVIKLMELAHAASKNDAKPVSELLDSKVFNSYYFALSVLKMFDNDLNFYAKETTEGLEEEIIDEAPHIDYGAQIDKMKQLEAGTRKFNARAASNEKLRVNRQICQSYNLPTALDIVETEMMDRGLIQQTTRQAKILAAQQAQKAAQGQPENIIKFEVMDFHPADMTFVRDAADTSVLIRDSAGANEPQAKIILRYLICALCLGKPSGFIQALKSFLVNQLHMTEGELKKSINNCINTPTIIARLNQITNSLN